MSNDVDDLMTKAHKQLAEHALWLAAEIQKIPGDPRMDGGKALLVAQTSEIRVRMGRVVRGVATIVWDYPDELYAFLRSDVAPKHLRDTLSGGHLVSSEQPAFSAKRVFDVPVGEAKKS